MHINIGGNSKPNSLEKLADKTDSVLKKLDKIQRGTKRSPKPASPTKPSARNVRIKETVKETTQKSEMLNKGQFKKAPK
jgi:flagellar biosynthesis/type III secretory pathway chaperone